MKYKLQISASDYVPQILGDKLDKDMNIVEHMSVLKLASILRWMDICQNTKHRKKKTVLIYTKHIYLQYISSVSTEDAQTSAHRLLHVYQNIKRLRKLEKQRAIYVSYPFC